MRDPKTEEFKRLIGHGVKIKMDDAGNILIKRVSKSNVYIKNTSQDEETAIGSEILKVPSCALEMERPVKLFDMKKFQSNVNRELRRAYPDRRRLECQCLSAIAFVKNELELLECPIWILIINVVAMDMLKSKLPPVQKVVDIKNRPRIPIPDEDPYSVAGNGSGSSGSSGFATGSVAATREQLLLQTQQNAQRRSEKPPKLPPRENMYHHNIPKPDYDEEEKSKPFASTRSTHKNKDESKYDDPYYCGLRARVPNFVSKSKGKESGKSKDTVSSKRYSLTQHHSLPNMTQYQQHHMIQQQLHQHPMWHRGNFENESDNVESPYNQIYGRLPIPTRGYIPTQPRTMYIGEWD